ncbi:MAG: hypothetical protein QN717_10750 [Nitrososphaeraceae archaeon]|nr:hypothetical protein [Nitrososphaeraceae archaeon]
MSILGLFLLLLIVTLLHLIVTRTILNYSNKEIVLRMWWAGRHESGISDASKLDFLTYKHG